MNPFQLAPQVLALLEERRLEAERLVEEEVERLRAQLDALESAALRQFDLETLRRDER